MYIIIHDLKLIEKNFYINPIGYFTSTIYFGNSFLVVKRKNFYINPIGYFTSTIYLCNSFLVVKRPKNFLNK